MHTELWFPICPSSDQTLVFLIHSKHSRLAFLLRPPSAGRCSHNGAPCMACTMGRAVWTGWWALPGVLVALLACGGDTAGPNPPNPVASISVTPSSDTLILPLSVQLSAVVRDSSGTPLSGYAVAWASSDPTVATVSATGLVATVGLGVATITATTSGKTGSAVLTVAPLITITPRRPSMFAGDTVHLVAQVTDANGTPVDAGAVDWTSGAPSVATVSPSGIAQGAASGLATISASAGAGRGDVVIAVLQPTARPNREIAFITEGTARAELHTIQPDGSGERLVSIGEFAGQFTWSPDGNRLAVTYLQHNGVGITGLYVSNADGSDPFRVFDVVYAPQWSPDGSRIAFSWCISSLDECDIVTINATGTGARSLTTQLGSEQSPQWSPDGRRIAYVRIEPAGATLWVMDDDGSHQQQLPLPINTYNPRWSPDGKIIAVDNGVGVWLVNADGSHPRPLTANCGSDGVCDETVRYVAPDWSFDGQKIAYQSLLSSNLTVVVSTASGVQLAQGGPGRCCFPSSVPQWSPDGTQIAYFGTQPAYPPWPGVAVMGADATGSQFITGAQNAISTLDTQNPGGGRRWRP